ncbi:MAG: hypothetical protein Q4B06_02030 [Candidatus Saccharibacteria bacterium]|nr:hypothetical protein [Candidatus Saccharibacteria bacterium]
MKTKLQRLLQRTDMAVLGCLLVLSLSLGLANGAGALGNGTIHPSWRGNSLTRGANRDDDRCYSFFSAGSTALSQSLPISGINALIGAIDPAMGKIQEPKFGLVNAIVRLPIYDWDQKTPEKANAINGFAERDAKPVGYANEFRFDITPVPSLAWLSGLASDPQSITSIFGKTANPFLYQQASILNPRGTPAWRLFQGINNQTHDYSPANHKYTYNKYKQYAEASGAISLPDRYFKDEYEKREQYIKELLVRYVRYAADQPHRAERHVAFGLPDHKKPLTTNYPQVVEDAVRVGMERRKREASGDSAFNEDGIRKSFLYALQDMPDSARRNGMPQSLFGNEYIDHWNDVRITKPDRFGRDKTTIVPRVFFATDDEMYNKVKNGAGSYNAATPGLGGLEHHSGDLMNVINDSFNFQNGVNSQLQAGMPGNATNNLRDMQRELYRYRNYSGSDLSSIADTIEVRIGNLASRLFGPTGKMANVQVRASDQYAMCYEYANAPDLGRHGAVPKVPSYAFSVPNTQLPIVIPGWLFSIQSLLIGKGPSYDGITFLFQGSYNGKMMLDCYGRGNTNTLRQDKEDYIGKYSLKTLFELLGAVFGAGDDDTKQRAGWQAIGFAIESLTRNWKLLDHIKVPYVRQINYYNGLFNVFQVTDRSSVVLPPELADREIDWERSKLTWMEGIRDGRFFTMGREANHAKSTNADTYFPHIFLRLKRPHNLRGEVRASNLTPDGTKGIKAEVSVKKGGYTDTVHPYDKHDTTNSGPIKHTKLRVVEVVLKPGSAGKKIRAHGFEQRYIGQHGLYFNNDRPVNGLNDDEICRFYRERLGNDAVVSCDDGDNREKALTAGEPGIRTLSGYDNYTGTIKLGTIVRDIPPETPPGTKYCYAVYIDKMDNDLKYPDRRYYTRGNSTPNFNPGYYAHSYKRYLSSAECIVSGYRPSVQVRGGDAIVNGYVFTETNRKDRLGAAGSQRTYGSWAEYALIGSRWIENMASGGAYRTGLSDAFDYDPYGFLTFSNQYTARRMTGNRTSFGSFKDSVNDGVDRLQAFFALRQKGAVTPIAPCIDGTIIRLSRCGSQRYTLPKKANYKIDATGFDAKKATTLVFYVGDKARLHFINDVKLPESYVHRRELSQIVFVPATTTSKYLIDIDARVSQIDAWLLNPQGIINTCYVEGVATDTPRSRSGDGSDVPHPCYTNRLVVNGPVAVKKLYLRRSSGEDQHNQPPYELRQSISGETFNLRPDAYLWALGQVDAGQYTFTTVQTVDLPPRY